MEPTEDAVDDSSSSSSPLWCCSCLASLVAASTRAWAACNCDSNCAFNTASVFPPQRRFVDEDVVDAVDAAEDPNRSPLPKSVEKEPQDAAGEAILGYFGGVESLQKEKMSESASDLRLYDEDDADINDVIIIIDRDPGDTGVVVEDEGLLRTPAAPSETTPPLAPAPPMVAGGVEKVDGAFEGEFSLDWE